MATYDLEEQEQLAEIKLWWKQYGNLLINVVTAAAIVFIAWFGWNWYQRNQAGQASTVYNVLQKAAQEKDNQRLKAASGELLEKFSGSSYAALGALTAAKAMIDAGDVKTAKLQLQWVVEHGSDEFRDLARLRLAALLLDEKAEAEALKVLDGKVSAGFEARVSDMRGDILSTQGKKDEAVAAYKKALDKLSAVDAAGKRGSVRADSVFRELVQQKLDALGGAK